MAPIRLIAMLDGWVREAVARHGDNWPAIMAALSASPREVLRAVQDKIPLRSRAGSADSSAR